MWEVKWFNVRNTVIRFQRPSQAISPFWVSQFSHLENVRVKLYGPPD
jgi:hypothetical protein